MYRLATVHSVTDTDGQTTVWCQKPIMLQQY